MHKDCVISEINSPLLDDGPHPDHQNILDILIDLPQVVENAYISAPYRESAQQIISPDHLILSVILIGCS